MAIDPSESDVIARPGGRPEGAAPGGVAGLLEKFNQLPRPAKIAVVVVAVLGFMMVFGGGSKNTKVTTPNTINLGITKDGGVSGTTFSGLETDRPALMQSVYEQQRRDMAEFKGQVEDYFKQQQDALTTSKAESEELKRQMTQMMSDFTAEIKNIQAERARDSERLSQLSDQQKQIEMSAPVDGNTSSAATAAGVSVQRRPLTQHPMGVPPEGTGKSLLNGAQLNAIQPQAGEKAPPPFIPPLGFVRGTLLNGVDALTGGTSTPGLVRLSGTYKTAMNTTVSLDGCIVLMGFTGNVSTERADGKPQRMTCVYPDGGAASYELSGYAVDAEDGIIGVPGVFYEGDSNRIAAATLADFAAGIGDIVAQNQETTTTNSTTGASTKSLTGSQAKAELAGGLNKSMSTLRDYLMERVNRVLPFIRLDAMREVNLVLLSGTQLRAEGGGSAWTQLFDAATADAARGGAQTTAAPAAVQGQ